MNNDMNLDMYINIDMKRALRNHTFLKASIHGVCLLYWFILSIYQYPNSCAQYQLPSDAKNTAIPTVLYPASIMLAACVGEFIHAV